jgi:beta-lactamase class A
MLPHAIALWMATAVACSPTAIKDSVKAAARPAHGKVGVSARVIETSKSFEFHGGQHFPMQSVYKLPIAIAVLHRVESGNLKLDQIVHVEPEQLIPPAGHSPLRDKHPKGGDFTLEDLLKRSIVDSDGSASDAVMRLLGGPREVRRYMKQAEIKQIHVEHTEMQLIDNNHFQYDDWAKPDGMIDLLARLQTGKLLNEANTSRLLGWMKETATGTDRIRAKLPKGTEVADKTGTSGINDGIAPATNDVGLVTLPNGQHMAISIFISDAKGDTKTRNAAIAGIAQELWDCWAEEQK